MALHLPTITEAKSQAKRLRAQLANSGDQITHSRALELVAAQYGFADWNTFYATAGNQRPEIVTLGQSVSGRYLGQSFEGVVHSVTQAQPGWVQVVLDLDTPVDVVTFDSFSNFRSRIRGRIGPDGHSRERTSDGTPHLALDL